jgi:putative phage-type endonuclease
MLDPSEVEQGSAAWLSARCGKVTASRIADLCAKTKSGYSASRATYMKELLVERLTGKASEHFVNDAMAWGTEYEPMARGVYEAKNSAIVLEVGFIPHPSIPNAGASPDGLVGDEGLLEIKCPTTGTHLETILGGEIPEKYKYQMAWQLECTGRKWCDFVSYDPRIMANAGYFQARFDASYKIAALEDGHHYTVLLIEYIRAEVIKFLAELDELEARVRAYKA